MRSAVRVADKAEDALAVRHATCRVVIEALQLVYTDTVLTPDDRETVLRAMDVFRALLNR